MGQLQDGESVEVPGGGESVYTLKLTGGVYSCTCPGWRFQRLALDKRTCKHLRAYLGEEAEQRRTGGASPPARRPAPSGAASGPASAAPSSTPAGQAPKLLLAHRFVNDIDIRGWWMSEKLDGVRAYWDGEHLISRLGNLYLAPDWFTERFPAMPLDGELFVGAGAFQRTVSIVRRQDRSDDWREVRYLVFDAPAAGGPFEERLRTVEQALEGCGSPYVACHPHAVCEGVEHLERELERVEAEGAEGLMLRQPGSPYQVGRSWTLLKVKSFHDAEGKVVAHLPGTGKHAGRLGALMLELPGGLRFKAGTGLTDAERESPPPIGAIVTFRYQELTNAGVPRFPSFVGERHDLAWEELVMAPRRASPTAGAPDRRRVLAVPAPAPPPAAGVVRPAAPEPPPPPDLETSGNVYLEFLKGRTVRFWEIEWEGVTVYVEYGRVDREPKTRTQTFPDPQAAARFAERQIRAKRQKGYVDEL